MNPFFVFSSVLAVSLAISASGTLAPSALAHVGHGDEFEATGGINRVEVKAETDSILGIQVTAIAPATDGSGAVLVPVTALVDDNSGRQLVFVQYEGFYEPVDVVTGETQGELIAVTEGLSVGEQLVTQGGLSLYAESRKAAPGGEASVPANAASTETANTETTDDLAATEGITEAGADADAKEFVQGEPGALSKKLLIAAGMGAAVVGGAVVISAKRRGKKENA